VAARLAREYPETNRLAGAGLTSLHEFLVGDRRTPLLVLLGSVALLLLLACANVANLFLVRTGERRRELAVRAALGAGRKRLVRGLLVEGVVLALAGGALGLLVGLVGIRGLVALQPGEIVPPDGLRLDPSVLAFTAALSLATVLLFALVPALRAGRLGAGETLKEGGRGAGGRFSGGRDGGLLVAGEVALAVLVVGGAALMGRSFLELRDVDPGFRVENRLTATISLPGSSYDSGEEIVGFYDALLDRLEGLPGVRSAAVTRSLPLADTYWTSEFTAESWDAGEYGVDVRHREVSEGYFRTMGVPVLLGRSFTREDRAGSPRVIVVNEALAERYFPDENPVGARVAFAREPSERSTWYTVVGVVGNERQSSLRAEAGPEIVAPFRQDWTTTVRVVLHAEGAPAVLAEPLRREVRALDPDLPVFRVRSLEGVFAESLARERFLLVLLAVFAATALLLASLGIYGVTARTTRRRTREIGVRIAVGARGRDVLGMVLARGGVMVGGGLAVGLACAAVAGRALESLLFGVSPTDPPHAGICGGGPGVRGPPGVLPSGPAGRACGSRPGPPGRIAGPDPMPSFPKPPGNPPVPGSGRRRLLRRDPGPRGRGHRPRSLRASARVRAAGGLDLRPRRGRRPAPSLRPGRCLPPDRPSLRVRRGRGRRDDLRPARAGGVRPLHLDPSETGRLVRLRGREPASRP